MTAYTTASITISTESALDAKTLHLLRQRLETALDETVDSVLAEFDIKNEELHNVSLDEIEVEEAYHE